MIEEYINTLLIEEIRKDKKTKIEIGEDSIVYITAGPFHRAKYDRRYLSTIYKLLKENNKKIPASLLAHILGAKNE